MKKIITFSLSVFSGLGLLKIFSIVPFNRMAADDFSSAVMARFGVLKALITTYNISMGRFASILLETIFVKNSGTEGKILMYSVVTFVLLILAFVFFFQKLLKLKYTNLTLYLLAFVSVSVLYLLTPNKSESWYWLTGSATYLWPIILFLFAISFLFKDKLSKVDYFVSLILIFMATSCNESFGFLLVTGFLVASAFSIIDKKNKKLIRMMFVASSISFLIMYLAPGNKTHAAGPATGRIPMSYLGASMYSLKEGPLGLFTVFADNYYVLIPLMFILSHLFSREQELNKNKNLSINYLFEKIFSGFAFALSLSVFYMLPAFKNLGEVPPERSDIALSLILLILLISISYNLASIVNLLKLNYKEFYKLVLLFSSVFLLSSSYVFTKDLAKDVYIAKNYSSSYDEMISEFKQRNVNNDLAEVEVSLPEPGLIPITLDPPGRYSYKNQTLSEFFQVGKVVTVEYEEN